MCSQSSSSTPAASCNTRSGVTALTPWIQRSANTLYEIANATLKPANAYQSLGTYGNCFEWHGVQTCLWNSAATTGFN